MVQSRSVHRGSGASFAVLWDLDGVLADTSSYHLAAWRRLMADFGRGFSKVEFRSTFGMRNLEILPRLLPGLDESELARLSERKEAWFRELLPERIPPLPGVEHLVNALAAAGHPQAIASSTPRANLEAILPRLGLPLSVYVSAEDVTQGKPNPEVFLKAAQLLAVPPARCVVAEDSVAGVEAARRGGMACLGVTTTWPPERLAGAGAVVVDSLEEVSVEDLGRLVEKNQVRGGGQET